MNVEEEKADTILPMDTIQVVEPQVVAIPKNIRPWIAIKNNLLYDLALAPNIEIERWFGKDNQWSIMIDWMSPWYTWHKNSIRDSKSWR